MINCNMTSKRKNIKSNLNSDFKKVKPLYNKKLIKEVLESFKQLSNYDHFIIPNEDNTAKFKNLTKCLYDYGQQLLNDLNMSITNKSTNVEQSMKPLKNLLVDNFDDEQVWQQLEVLNQLLIDYSIAEISHISSSRLSISFNVDMDATDISKSKEIVKPILKPLNNESFIVQKQKKKVTFTQNLKNFTPKDNSPSEINFLDIEEMERYLDKQDEKEMQNNVNNQDDDDDKVDHFYNISSDEEDDENNNPMYSDFFDPPSNSQINKRNENEKEENISDEDEDYDGSIELDTRDYELGDEELEKYQDDSENNDGYDENNQINEKLRALANNDNDSDLNDDFDKSEYEKSQTKLKQKIKKAEQDLILPHNLRWQFSGEITGDVRPTNSLLEEHIQFDHVSRPAPFITDETTATLESLIKQRIKDKVFDDVERKIKPKEQPFEFRRRIILESEKSKIGLAEVYEQEYLKQQQKQKEQELSLRSGAFIAVGETEDTETRKKIRSMIRTLFRKLDSLSAFHYTPHPPEPEVKIINNLPAVTVEEVVPDSVNDMKLLAPEEVYSTRNKKVLQDKAERTKTDKRRARRLKKKKQGIKQQFLKNKLKLQTNSKKITKEKSMIEAIEDGRSLSSSTKFFKRLEEKKEIGKIPDKSKSKVIPQTNLSKVKL